MEGRPFRARHPPAVKRSPFATGDRSACYVRVIAGSLKTCPSWHAGNGQKAWLFVDEVVIE